MTTTTAKSLKIQDQAQKTAEVRLAADGSRWIASRASFLLPVRALSRVFRAKYLAGPQRAFDAGQLTFADGTAALADRATFTLWLQSLRAIDWVV